MKKIILWIIAIILICDITALFLFAAAIVGPNIYWEIEIRNILADMKKNGEPTSWKDFKKPIIPDSENSAVSLKEAFVLMKESKGEVSGEILNKRVDFIIDKVPSDNSKIAEIIDCSEPVKKEVSEILYSEQLKKIFAKLEEATLKPAFSFNVNYEKGFECIPDWYYFRGSVKLLCMKAFFDAGQSNLDVVYENLISALRLAQYCDTEPLIIYNFFKISSASNAIYSSNAIIEKYGISENNAIKLLEQLDKIDVDKSSRNAFVGEKCLCGIPSFNEIIKGKYSEKSYYFSVPMTFFERFILLLFERKEFVEYLKMMSAFERMYALPPWEREKEFIKIQEQIPKYCFLIRGLALSWGGIFKKNCVFMTDIAKLKINLALRIYKERNGKYPDSLDALKPSILEKLPVNYTNGQEFFYKNSDSDFILK